MKKSLRENLQALLPRVHLLRCRNIKWAKGECVLNQIVFAAGVLLFPAVCTTLGAAGVFLLRRSAAPRTQRVLSGMAAGIMLAASVWSLLLPAIERTRELGVAAWVPPSAGLVLGAAGLLRLESMAGQLLQRGKSRMVLAVTLHNLPEGMVVGLAAALALLIQRFQRLDVFRRGLLGIGGRTAFDGLGGAQTDIPACAGDGIGQAALFACQHTLAAFQAFPIGFVHRAAPPFV